MTKFVLWLTCGSFRILFARDIQSARTSAAILGLSGRIERAQRERVK